MPRNEAEIKKQNQRAYMRRNSSITLLLESESEIMIRGMKDCLRSRSDIKVLGTALSTSEAAAKATKLKPEIMVLEIKTPGSMEIANAEEYVRAFPFNKIIVIIREENWGQIRELIKVGVRGYLTNVCSIKEFQLGVDVVHEGKIFFSSELKGFVENSLVQTIQTSIESRFSSLTKCERKILDLIASGLTNKEMSGDMGTAVRTIETHRAAVMRKLSVRSVAEVVKFAIRCGRTQC